MAPGQKETILEKDQRETLLLSATPPLWLTPPGSLSGQSSHGSCRWPEAQEGQDLPAAPLGSPCSEK